MHNGAIVPIGGQLAPLGGGVIPRLFVDAGEEACRRYVEFFAATIRNPNTREAYLRAVRQFSTWCERYGVALAQLSAVVTSLYIEELGRRLDRPSVKQHLAAIRMLCDWLVTGHVLLTNPAASVRGPKHVVRRGKTPVLTAEQTRQLIDSIDVSTLIGLRDRAIIGSMVTRKSAGTSAAISIRERAVSPVLSDLSLMPPRPRSLASRINAARVRAGGRLAQKALSTRSRTAPPSS